MNNLFTIGATGSNQVTTVSVKNWVDIARIIMNEVVRYTCWYLVEELYVLEHYVKPQTLDPIAVT